MVGILVDLFSIYRCPTTNIKAANTIVNRAFANWWTWIIFPHPIKRFYIGTTLFRSIKFRPIGRREPGHEAARASILPATGSRTALRGPNVYHAARGVDLGGWLRSGRNRFFRFEQALIALGLSQKLLAFRTRLIFLCRLKFADDDLVQLFDGPMRYRFPAHGPTKTLILVLDQSTLVPYFYGCDPCFLRVRSFGITHWLVRRLDGTERHPSIVSYGEDGFAGSTHPESLLELRSFRFCEKRRC